MGNTRICPTLNGALHIGHAYLALVNQAEAEAMGGKLYCRFDDSQSWWKDNLGTEKMIQLGEAMKEDLAWLGLNPTYKSDAADFPDIMEFCRYKLPDAFLFDRQTYILPHLIPNRHAYPFAPWLTAVHVVQDYRDEITKVIRGMDLLPEHSLYMAFCEMLDLPKPEHWYIPRLQQVVNCGCYTVSEELTDVAKSAVTGADWSLRKFREECSPSRLIERLADVCLKDRHDPRLIENVRPQPKVYEGGLL